jgi:hypothetical protein
MAMKHVSALLCVAALLSACSTAQVYEYVADLTDPDCSRISNADDRDRCRKTANVSYEKYEKERQKAKGN